MIITELPLNDDARQRLIKFSNESFLTAARRAGCVRKVKNKWNADEYVDGFIKSSELPVEVDYIESLIEATIFHQVLHILEERQA